MHPTGVKTPPGSENMCIVLVEDVPGPGWWGTESELLNTL